MQLKRVLVKRIKHADDTISKPGVALFFCMTRFKYEVYNSAPEWYRQDLVWVKNRCGGFYDSKRKMLVRHEDILVFSSNLGTYNPQMKQGKPYVKDQKNHRAAHMRNAKGAVCVNHGTRYPDTVLKYANVQRSGHETAKPIKLIEELVLTYSNEGDTVLDPTAGGGVVIEASLMHGRNVIAIELEEKYYEMCKARTKAVQPPLI